MDLLVAVQFMDLCGAALKDSDLAMNLIHQCFNFWPNYNLVLFLSIHIRTLYIILGYYVDIHATDILIYVIYVECERIVTKKTVYITCILYTWAYLRRV